MDVTENAQPGQPEESALARLAREHNDPDLFPKDVLRLYDLGKAIAARKALVKAIKKEGNPHRKVLQKELVEDLRLWAEPLGGKAPGMYTLNGVGTTLYGNHQESEGGWHIGTLWFVFVFVPIWPLGGYLVAKAEEGGWHFAAKTPIPPMARGWRSIVASILLAGLAALAFGGYESATKADVVAYNGYDVPVVVAMGDEQQTVPAEGYRSFSGLPLGETAISATVVGQSEPFDELIIDTTGHAYDSVVYNVGRRASLVNWWAVYGPGAELDPVRLPPESVHFLDDIDYLFVEPPESKQVSEGSTVRSSVLVAEDAGMDAAAALMMLLSNGGPEAARILAEAQLRVHPEDSTTAMLASRLLMSSDEGKELFRGLIARSPESVDLHRYYQELFADEEKPALLTEYRKDLDASPTSPMANYLVGRLLDRDPDAAGALFLKAVELDPSYAPAWRALGWNALMAEDYPAATTHYQRFAALGPAEREEALPFQLRLAQLTFADASVFDQLLAEGTKDGAGGPVNIELAAHLMASRSPGELAAATAMMKAEGDRSEIEADAPWRAYQRGSLALSAGDLALARQTRDDTLNAGATGFAADLALRLALSDGATDSDRDAFRALLDEEVAGALGPGMALLALALPGVAGSPGGDALRVGLTGSESEPVADALAARALNPTDAKGLLRGLPPHVRAGAAYALSFRLRTESQRASNELRELARRFGLPAELPFLR